MSDSFDPYYNWLAIPPEEQPANHYRLLGLRLFEANADVIETSADRQMGHVRRYGTGQRAELSQKILNEIAAAKVCLLNPAKRAAYDATLKAKQAATALPQAQALPKAQALPTAQALPPTRATTPKLRTREEHTSPSGQEIPIVAAGSGTTSSVLRKKKSSPVVAVVALLVGAALLIGGIAFVLKKPETVAVSPEIPVDPAQPNQVVADEPEGKSPAEVVEDQPGKNETEKSEPEEIESEKTDIETDTPAIAVSTGGAPSRYTPNKPFNLFTDFELSENIVAGEGWQFANNVLTIPEGDKARIQTAVTLPEEYMLALTVERLSGNGDFHLGLPIKDGGIVCAIDNTFRDASVFATGFFAVEGEDLNVNRDRQRLPLNEPVQVMCVVRNDNFQLNIGGKMVVSWRPNGRELKPSHYWSSRDPGRLVIGGDFSSFKVSRLMVMPIEPRKVAGDTGSSGTPGGLVEGKAIDLLAGLDLENAPKSGEPWTLDEGVLHVPSYDPSRIQFPDQLPPEYTISLVAERLSGEEHFALGLPSPSGYVYSLIDVTYNQPDGRPAAGFFYSEGDWVTDMQLDTKLMTVGKPVRIKCTVQKKEVALIVDGKTIKTWKPSDREHKEHEYWAGPHKNRFMLGGKRSTFKISNLELRPLQSAAIAATPMGTDSASSGTGSTSGTSKTYGKPVDLLTGLDLDKAVVAGEPWSLENGVLHVPDVRSKVGARMQPPHEMPTEYALSMIVERKSGKEDFMLGLPCSSGNINCAIDDLFAAGDTYTTGFFNGSDEKNPLAAQTRTQFLLQDKPTQVDVVLKNELITLSINGRLIAKWKPDGRKLVEYEFWKCPQKNCLMVGSFQSGFKVSRLEFKPIVDGAIASTGSDNGPDTDQIVSEFGEPILEGDGPDANDDEPSGNSIGPRSTTVAEKVDPPSAEKQKETLATVKGLFPDEYAAAKSPAAKLELGRKLLETARSTMDDPVAFYVLLTEALNYAAEAGDATLAMQAFTLLESSFNVDSIAVSVETFTKLQKGARQNAEHKMILDHVRAPIATAVEADRYAEADKLLKIALTSGRALKDSATMKEVTASGKMLREAQATYDKVKLARDKLAKDANDPTANSEWGLYLCLVKNNFAAGIPLLAKGADAKYQAVAKLDLAEPAESKAQIAVGDQWYALAESATGTAQALLRLRAEHWYRQGVAELTGLDKTRVEKRIREIGEIDRSNLPRPVGREAGAGEVAGALAGPSLAGFCEHSNKRLPTLFTYQTGTKVDGAKLREYLTDAGVAENANFRITMAGTLELRERMEVQFWLVCWTPAGGLATLFIDGNNELAVGDKRNQDVVTRRTLEPGKHAIIVQLEGGDIGSYSLTVLNDETHEPLPMKAQTFPAGPAKGGIRKTVNIAEVNVQ